MNAPKDSNESVGTRCFDLQRNQSGPRDTDVEAIVGRATRGSGGVVARSGREPDVPILGRRDLRGVGFVAADEPSELPARLCRSSDRQQEVPHHRHRVRAEDEPLDVREVERRPSRAPDCRHSLRVRVAFRPSNLSEPGPFIATCDLVHHCYPVASTGDLRSASRARMSWTERPG